MRIHPRLAMTKIDTKDQEVKFTYLSATKTISTKNLHISKIILLSLVNAKKRRDDLYDSQFHKLLKQ